MTPLACPLALIAALVAIPAHPGAAQRASTPPAAMPESAQGSTFAGTYEFSFIPSNGEPVTGRLVITLKRGRYYGVFTSPKLSEPLDADSVHAAGSRLFTSNFGGMYTFAFDLHGTSITNATFTKTLRGVTETGTLAIKKIRP